jgi:hypothetical protein
LHPFESGDAHRPTQEILNFQLVRPFVQTVHSHTCPDTSRDVAPSPFRPAPTETGNRAPLSAR